ncbi:unnamed protein product [Triticum turgidum subsp. durum]|uniref:WAT1-related protein n=1 Tax=Triticum turgidum subsp. durum TaxID=4567 RepID=A0A9R0VN38_TRITD|nr:unnamed protein product [Triticum turgidum subsp. durum]
MGGYGDLFEKAKPYIAMICLQFGYAGMNVITKVSLNGGMSHYVLVVYRHAFATVSIAPFALIFERPVIDQNFYYVGLKYTGPTFACAMSNILPAMTFVMAFIFREWFLGSLFIIIATLAWASLFILQAHTLKQYSAPLSLTTLICFVGTLQAIVVTLAMEHRPSVWTIGFDMNLLAAAYAGIVTSSIAYYVQGLVIQKTGPVFASAFSPLMMIVVAVMGSFILSEKIYLGGVLGSVLIVIGLYSVLWGKHKETQAESAALREAMASINSKGDGDAPPAAARDPVRDCLVFPPAPPPAPMDRLHLCDPARRPRESNKVIVATPALEIEEHLLRQHTDTSPTYL